MHRQSGHHPVAVNIVERHAGPILFEKVDKDPIQGALLRQQVSEFPSEANDRGLAEFTFDQFITVPEQICPLDRCLPVAQECPAVRRQRRA